MSRCFPKANVSLGTGIVISPIVVNDNVIDVIASPGATEGAPVSLKISPKTAYVSIINQATTGKAGSKASLDYTDEKLNPDGTRSVAAYREPARLERDPRWRLTRFQNPADLRQPC